MKNELFFQGSSVTVGTATWHFSQTNIRRVLTRKMKYPNLSFFLVWNVASEPLTIKYLKAEMKKYNHGSLHEYKLNFEFTEHIKQMTLMPQWLLSLLVLPLSLTTILIMKQTNLDSYQSNNTKGFGQNPRGTSVTCYKCPTRFFVWWPKIAWQVCLWTSIVHVTPLFPNDHNRDIAHTQVHVMHWMIIFSSASGICDKWTICLQSWCVRSRKMVNSHGSNCDF